MEFFQERVHVTSREEIAPGIFVLRFRSPAIARQCRPGQFVNIRSDASFVPLLRRPFSISDVDKDEIEMLFNVVGKGTQILSRKIAGDEVDLIGPLGRPFDCSRTATHAMLVGGGLGVAPFPFLTRALIAEGHRVTSFVGARTADQVISRNIKNCHVATDDGTKGFHGTVVELLRCFLEKESVDNVQIYGCGPAAMMRALSNLAHEKKVRCVVSLEGDMACGIGICQGCPVERREGEKKYSLVCTEGPVFDCEEIVIR